MYNIFIKIKNKFESIIGIEPTSSGWKPEALTVVLYRLVRVVDGL